MKILLIGSGAVGLGIATCLIGNADIEMHLIVRDDQTRRLLNVDGVRRTGIFGEYHCPASQFTTYASLSEVPECPYDLIFICTKSQSTPATVEELQGAKSVFSPETLFVLFQNGWGNAEQFAALTEPSQIYNARVITGFRRPQLNVSQVTVHAQDIHIGSLATPNIDPQISKLATVINPTISCKTTATIGKDIWAKMLYNCALNPLGAICKATYGALGDNPDCRLIMNSVIGEIFEVMSLCGYVTHWERPEEYIEVFYSKLVPITYAHESSMLQDIRASRQTEIEALNGAVIRLAQNHALPTVVNSTLVRMIHFLESQVT